MAKKYLLPMVKKEIFDSLLQETRERDNSEILKDWLLKMNKNNPVLATFLYNYYDSHLNSREKATIDKVLWVTITLYRALESQAEADQMEEDIKI